VRVVPLFVLRVDAAAVDADAQGTVMLAGDGRQVANLVLPRLALLVMVQVTGIVANFIHVGRHAFRQAVVLLEIDRQVGRTLPTDLRQGRGVCRAIGRDADDICPGLGQRLNLGDGRVDVLSMRRGHALDGDGLLSADHDRSNSHRASWISGKIH